MFEFAKRRIKEIEALVTKKYNEEKKIEQARVTRLKNSAIQSNIGQVQKEMLQGNYAIRLDARMAYHKKIVKMANEPVAFHLYKNRDFH